MLSKKKLKNLAKNLLATLQVEINPLMNKLENSNIKKETEELDEKLLRDPPSRNNPLVNKLEYKDTKKTLQA